MNRKQFMDRLEMRLIKLPKTEREDVLRYYSEYFDDAYIFENDEVSQDMDPDKIARDILMDYNLKEMKNTGETKAKWNYMIIIILALISAPVSLPILLLLFIVLFSVFISLGAVFFAIIVSLVAIVFGLASLSFKFMLVFPVLGVGIALLIIGLLLIIIPIISFLVNKFISMIAGILSWAYKKIVK